MGTLELKGVKKRYPEFTLEIDLSVNEGEFLTIIGPSGYNRPQRIGQVDASEHHSRTGRP